MADFLRGSGLPRRVLKQIWLAANPNSQSEFSMAEFSVCLRLTGHCQAVLSSGDAGAAELLVEGGEALKELMNSEWMHRPPPVLPRFQGNLVEPPYPAGDGGSTRLPWNLGSTGGGRCIHSEFMSSLRASQPSTSNSAAPASPEESTAWQCPVSRRHTENSAMLNSDWLFGFAASQICFSTLRGNPDPRKKSAI